MGLAGIYKPSGTLYLIDSRVRTLIGQNCIDLHRLASICISLHIFVNVWARLRPTVARVGLDLDGLDRTVLDWVGFDWFGLGWNW